MRLAVGLDRRDQLLEGERRIRDFGVARPVVVLDLLERHQVGRWRWRWAFAFGLVLVECLEGNAALRKAIRELLADAMLAILAEGESYGYAILKRVRALSGGELEWTDGMLYPLLHRLRRLGYVTTEWRTPPEGRRRQYYMLTDDGRAALADQRRQWETITRALNDVWPGSGGLLTAVAEA